MTASWEAMELTYVGDIADVLQKANGKLSIVCGDPGEEPKKPKGQEPAPCQPENGPPGQQP